MISIYMRPITTLYLMTVVTIAVVLLMSGCTSSATSAAKTYTMDNNGQTINIKKGETIKVVLEENPSTGYSWKFNVTDGLNITENEYNQGTNIGTNNTMPIVGASGSHTWVIKADGSGTQKINAVYKRKWEPANISDLTFTLNVTIE